MTRIQDIYEAAIKDALAALGDDDEPDDAERSRRLAQAQARLDIARRQIRAAMSRIDDDGGV